MANEGHCKYRGCSITTRWSESELPADEADRKFTASFSVDSPDAYQPAWQQFPGDVFRTPVRAAENALEAAKQSIDRRLVEDPLDRRDRGSR